MFHHEIYPGFNDTDALGHISNTVFPIWFENAREPVFRIFHPSLDFATWPLILARIEVDLLAQTYLSKMIEIRTYIGKIGNSSCQVVQEAWQDGIHVAQGVTTLIYFDYGTNSSRPIPPEIRIELEKIQDDKYKKPA